ncbi:hypothetical protein Rhe02_78970 [Rhizocola hellebori]|uniref:Uncharacterized protein n=1 Tax=Rhizocola hellebori TaxID=1392758 RepID=A0A8J3QHK3_9ACTN|nr:hypothetical protein Rhe02_78970 [Rhizocola hellebori]
MSVGGDREISRHLWAEALSVVLAAEGLALACQGWTWRSAVGVRVLDGVADRDRGWAFRTRAALA